MYTPVGHIVTLGVVGWIAAVLTVADVQDLLMLKPGSGESHLDKRPQSLVEKVKATVPKDVEADKRTEVVPKGPCPNGLSGTGPRRNGAGRRVPCRSGHRVSETREQRKLQLREDERNRLTIATLERQVGKKP